MKGITKAWRELINKGVEALENGRRQEVTADYVVMYEDGYVNAHPNSACHAGLQSYLSDGTYAIRTGGAIVINGLQYKDSATDKDKLLVIDFITKRSPWKNAFVQKDAKRILKQGYAVLRGDVPSHVMGGACVSFRIMWEQRQCLAVFCALVRAGVNESLAFFLSFSCNSTGKTLQWGTYGPGHCVIYNSKNSLSGVRDFIKGVPSKKGPDFTKNYIENGSYSGYSQEAWVGNGDGSWLRLLSSLKPLEEGVKVGETNPFIAARATTKKSEAYPFNAAIKLIVDNQELIMEKVMNA